MKTKNLFLALLLMTSGSLLLAQSPEKGETSFGILGGVNFQTFNGKDGNGDKLTNDLLVGYHAGVNIAIPVAPEFFFQPGVLFSIKGAKNEGSSITSTHKLSYIEVPLNLVYKGLLGSGYVMVGFGPYISYGIKGKVTYEGGSLSYEPEVEFKNLVDVTDSELTTYYKAMDAGGNIFVGYEMAGGLFFQLNAQMGMLNIKPEDNRIISNNNVEKNTGFGLSLGYRF